MKYDVIVIGAGPGGIFSAYELVQKNPDLKIAVFEAGMLPNNKSAISASLFSFI
jgi:flavin-dependent dehydrogenase